MQIGKINVSYSNDKHPSGVRQTSIDCYNQIKAEGLLSKTRLEIYKELLNESCVTAKELEVKMNYTYAHQRLSEMRELGVIYEKGSRVCRITGRQSIVWDLTDSLPKDVSNKPSRKQQRTNQALEALRDLYKNKESREKWLEVADLIKKI
jgi:hypothetical protein